ncbi:hypothetical protein DQ04_04431020 [Trypanosoma grayi]|uniref:hypothetical protein n=1 Tax=Trypanosoma grayi TaxID=71804 RepID=UPI0004F47725|nr:hypothetical protein DQ04_04431020 [Trypanosoma grayi]KEG09924.1 hypothetical protein DQ04_04431020 [Trypanosoma grayi]
MPLRCGRAVGVTTRCAQGPPVGVRLSLHQLPGLWHLSAERVVAMISFHCGSSIRSADIEHTARPIFLTWTPCRVGSGKHLLAAAESNRVPPGSIKSAAGGEAAVS